MCRVLTGVGSGTLILFALGVIAMRSDPHPASIGAQVVITAVGVAMAGYFLWGSIAVRRMSARLDGTVLRYRSGWFGWRSSDLAKVTHAEVVVNLHSGSAALRVRGDGNLRTFPLQSIVLYLPVHERDVLADALSQNSRVDGMRDTVSVLRGAPP